MESYLTLKREMDWIRKNRKPVLLEAFVSRLYGHSSASGANYVKEECCIKKMEKQLKSEKLLTENDMTDTWKKYREEAKKAQKSGYEGTGPERGNNMESYLRP